MKEELLRVENISKSFGSLKALDKVSLSITRGEIVGLVGDNGAGKSTLIKILMGIHKQDEGKIYFEGKNIKIDSPQKALSLGIEAVYQDKAIAPNHNIRENIFIGREIVNNGFLNIKKMNQETLKVINQLGLMRIKTPDKKVMFLSGGEQQGVALSRVLLFKAKLLFLDEPTAGVSYRMSTKTLRPLFTKFKNEGTTVIYVTHELERLYKLVDRIIILKAGKKVLDIKKKDITIQKIIDSF
jgi:ABC-type sugar transport system ATPase subunit